MYTFTLISYNVNSVRARFHILDYLFSKYEPDILCLQETKVEDSEFPTGYFKGKGYEVIFSGEKGRSGVAVVFKSSFETTLLSRGLQGRDFSRLMELSFDSFILFNVYVPQGRSPEDEEFKHKLDFLDNLLSYIDEKYSPKDPLLLVGDLNIAPSKIDVHSPDKLYGHVCFRDEVWERFKRFIGWGFYDLYRKFHPEPGHYTFFDYRVKDAVRRGLGWRVDHVLVTEPLFKKAIDALIDIEARLMDKPSDHAPLIVRFSL